MRALYCLLLICSLLPLSGCADLNISNPFETKSSDGSEVYFDQFPDVPIPRDMSVDAKRSLISVAQDGTKTGLITVEGRVDKPSLANAMILNMNRQGWNLRGAAIGSKTMHLYEKGERYAVIYYYEQTTTASHGNLGHDPARRRRPADHGQRRGRRRNGRGRQLFPVLLSDAQHIHGHGRRWRRAPAGPEPVMDAHLAFRGVGGPRLHLGVCGSVAAYRALDLVRQWQDAGVSVSATLTPSAQKFVTPLTFAALGAAPVYTAPFDDPQAPSPFAHLEPGQVAQALVIAPASAATIARLAQGQADELLACQALAFRGKAVIAPAMNPAMWSHPATQANIATLRERGCVVVEPGCGRTACGEEGQGRLADLREIYLAGLRALAPQDMEGIRVMVTLGPTREHWDGLRFWTNPSTGTMGAAVAVAAWLRGARVEAVCGPGTPWLPAGIARHNVGSARHMLEAAASVWPQCDAGVFTAAVADFSPVPPAQGGDKKFKKSDAPDGFDVHFAPNPDILKTLAADRRPDQKVVGFAAESQNLEDSVRGKLVSKKADMVVGNLLQDGFGTPDNTVFVADASGREERWAHLSKTDVAWRLLSWLLSR